MPELQNTSEQGTQSSGAQGNQQGNAGNFGTTGTQGTGASQGAGGALNNPGGGAAPVQLSEDSMVILPGSKDPVRYGDHYRGFQSEFTKRSQNLTAAQKRIEALERQVQQSQQGQQQGQQGQNTPDPFMQLATELNGLQYLNGPQAAAVVGHVMKRFQSMSKELRKRDYALGLMYKRIQAIQQHLGGVVQRHQGADFEAKIAKFTKDAGLPEDGREFVAELYSAYEGDDLDEQFPAILKKRLEQLASIHRKNEQRRIDEARGTIPGVTTQGGNGSTSRRLSNNFGKKSAAAIADELWDGIGSGQNT